MKDISNCGTINEDPSEMTGTYENGTDETDFGGRVEECSASSSLRCDNYTRCIEYEHICDGNSQCEDGQDEFGCHTEAFQLAARDPRGLQLVQNVVENATEAVCDDGFTDREATAVCRNNGKRFGKRGPSQTLSVGQEYKATFVECNAQTDRCEYNTYSNGTVEGVYECGPTEAAAVYCFDKLMDYEVRVVDAQINAVEQFTITLQIKYFKEGELFWLHNDAVRNKLRLYVYYECRNEEMHKVLVSGVNSRVDRSGMYIMSGRLLRDTAGSGCTVETETVNIEIDETSYGTASFSMTPTE